MALPQMQLAGSWHWKRGGVTRHRQPLRHPRVHSCAPVCADPVPVSPACSLHLRKRFGTDTVAVTLWPPANQIKTSFGGDRYLVWGWGTRRMGELFEARES